MKYPAGGVNKGAPQKKQRPVNVRFYMTAEDQAVMTNPPSKNNWMGNPGECWSPMGQYSANACKGTR